MKRIEIECARAPINLYLLEFKLNKELQLKLYQFGPNDEEFRSEMKKIVKTYIDTGKDIDGEDIPKFVSKYMPKYIEACTDYYAENGSHCSEYDNNSENYSNCAKAVDDKYRELFESYYALKAMTRTPASDESKIQPVDLEDFSIEWVNRQQVKLMVE